MRELKRCFTSARMVSMNTPTISPLLKMPMDIVIEILNPFVMESCASWRNTQAIKVVTSLRTVSRDLAMAVNHCFGGVIKTLRLRRSLVESAMPIAWPNNNPTSMMAMPDSSLKALVFGFINCNPFYLGFENTLRSIFFEPGPIFNVTVEFTHSFIHFMLTVCYLIRQHNQEFSVLFILPNDSFPYREQSWIDYCVVPAFSFADDVIKRHLHRVSVFILCQCFTSIDSKTLWSSGSLVFMVDKFQGDPAANPAAFIQIGQ